MKKRRKSINSPMLNLYNKTSNHVIVHMTFSKGDQVRFTTSSYVAGKIYFIRGICISTFGLARVGFVINAQGINNEISSINTNQLIWNN